MFFGLIQRILYRRGSKKLVGPLLTEVSPVFWCLFASSPCTHTFFPHILRRFSFISFICLAAWIFSCLTAQPSLCMSIYGFGPPSRLDIYLAFTAKQVECKSGSSKHLFLASDCRLCCKDSARDNWVSILWPLFLVPVYGFLSSSREN